MQMYLAVPFVETMDHSYKAIITLEGDDSVLVEAVIYELGYMSVTTEE